MKCSIEVVVESDNLDVEIEVCPQDECPSVDVEVDSDEIDIEVDVSYRQGIPGLSYQETFETVSKNLKSWAYSLSYASGILQSITYTNGALSVVKTLNYTSGVLSSVVLSGDVPSGISLTKTLNYTSGQLTSITYS